jgi:hypothetical protein
MRQLLEKIARVCRVPRIPLKRPGRIVVGSLEVAPLPRVPRPFLARELPPRARRHGTCAAMAA